MPAAARPPRVKGRKGERERRAGRQEEKKEKKGLSPFPSFLLSFSLSLPRRRFPFPFSIPLSTPHVSLAIYPPCLTYLACQARCCPERKVKTFFCSISLPFLLSFFPSFLLSFSLSLTRRHSPFPSPAPFLPHISIPQYTPRVSRTSRARRAAVQKEKSRCSVSTSAETLSSFPFPRRPFR